ncbi:MAG: ATP-binding cassette domain-containing protein [Vicinamibacterales bacterium]
MPHEPLLDVSGLTVTFDGAPRPALDGVSFALDAGRTLGVVGESGSGKSLTALTILRLLPPTARLRAGTVRFQGRDLATLSDAEIRAVRGAGISLIFQEPMTALDPVMRVGDQIAEVLRIHGLARGAGAMARAVDLLDAVRVPHAAQRARDYPHQLSGGLRQRVVIAMALACRPALVIADEPTTALDVTVQAEVLALLRDLREQYRLALLLITHDFGVIAQMADDVAVMHHGRIVEAGPVRTVLREPREAYTQALLAAVPGARL